MSMQSHNRGPTKAVRRTARVDPGILGRHTQWHWLLQRVTALLLMPAIFGPNAFYGAIGLNIFMFWHLSFGIEEILADYIHHDITRNILVILLRCLILIIMKYTFLFFVL